MDGCLRLSACGHVWEVMLLNRFEELNTVMLRYGYGCGCDCR